VFSSLFSDLPVNIDKIGRHTFVVIGQPLLDEQAGRIAVVLSTENLLLNPIRASKRGMGLQLMIDAEYRLVEEGNATMLIGISSLEQVFHVVAYAIVNKEDKEGQECCLREVKKGVEAAVKKNAGCWV